MQAALLPDRGVVKVDGEDARRFLNGLLTADIETATRARDKFEKTARGGDKDAKESFEVIGKLLEHLNSGKRALTAPLSAEEKAVAARLYLLTSKPILFACNVSEDELATAEKASPYVAAVRHFAETHLGTEAVVVSAAIEAELAELPDAEARDYLAHLGVADSGVSGLIRAAYHLLGLRTYLTGGEKEARAWTIHAGQTAPQAAGVIHSDFERGFIKAETVSYEDLAGSGSMAAAREKGLVRQEGKDYVVQDGDVMLFKFNV